MLEIPYRKPLGVAFIVLFVLGLLLDQTVPVWGQWITNVVVWCVFGGLLWLANAEARFSLLICVLYATLGELFLSLVWGLYEYRLHNVPLFVPAGHALLFTVGVWVAPALPASLPRLLPWAFLPYLIFATVTGMDTLNSLLFLMFLGCLRWGSAKALYATMFLLSLLLEIYGTWLGNWRWVYDVPWFGLTSINPPLAAGAFYCMLDVLVVWTLNRLKAERGRVYVGNAEFDEA